MLNKNIEKEGVISYLLDLIETIKTEDIQDGSIACEMSIDAEQNTIMTGDVAVSYKPGKGRDFHLRWKAK